MKFLPSIVLFLALVLEAAAQTPAFKRTGTNLPFVTTIASNQPVMIDRGGGQSPANVTFGTVSNIMEAAVGERLEQGTFNTVAADRVKNTFPLRLPTYDGKQEATHPSIYDAGVTKFGGHRYWLGYTPYPDFSRENPSIAFSDDGVEWNVPSGVPNPLFSIAEGNAIFASYGSPGGGAYWFWADSEIFRAGANLVMIGKFDIAQTAISGVWYAKTSTDGTNWSAIFPVYTNAGSVCMEVVDIGTGLRWFFGQSQTLKFVDSNYSLTGFGSVTTTGLNGVWHFDVQKGGANYWFLGTQGSGGTGLVPSCLFATSANGSTWSVVSTDAITPSGYDWDRDKYYKPDFIINSYSPINITLYIGSRQDKSIPGIDVDYGFNVWPRWRIGMFKNITLPHITNMLDEVTLTRDAIHAHDLSVTGDMTLSGNMLFNRTNAVPSSDVYVTLLNGAAGASDVDARRFCVAAGITNKIEQAAINTLVLDLKAADLWQLEKVIYPFLGGTSNSCAINLKNPTNFPIVFTATGITYDTTKGIKGDGTGYGDSGFAPSANLTVDNSRAFVVVTTAAVVPGAVQYYFGANGVSDTNLRLYSRQDSDSNGSFAVNTTANVGMATPILGMHFMQRTNANDIFYRKLWNAGYNTAAAQSGLPDRTMGVLAYHQSAWNNLSTAGISALAIGDALTPAQYTNYVNAWTTFNRTLSRAPL